MKGDKNNSVYTEETDPDLMLVRRNMEFQRKVDEADTPEKFAEFQRELSGGTLEVTPEAAPESPAKKPRKSTFAKGAKTMPAKMIAVSPDVHERFTVAKMAYVVQNGRSVGSSTFLSRLLDVALPIVLEDHEESMRLIRKLCKANRQARRADGTGR